MSTKPLTEDALAPLHDAMAGYVNRGEMPGVVTVIGRGDPLHINAVGTLAADSDAPMQRDTLFRISSMTKPIIAVAALMLVEAGKLTLDEPVDRLLPELANRRVLRRADGPLDDTVPAQRPITVRDVLTSRMGYGMVFAPEPHPIQQAMDELALGQGPPSPQTPPAPDEWLRRLSTLPLLHQPGERWLYNTSSDVLGVLVARAADQPLETVLRERLFAPLGMHDTGFSVPSAKLDRLATSYMLDATKEGWAVYDAPETSQWAQPPAFPSGAGGLISTAEDYGAFAQMLRNQGEFEGQRILSRQTVAQMTTNQLTTAQRDDAAALLDDNLGWGFGLSVTIKGDELTATPGRYGWAGGLGSSWGNDPNTGLVAILLTQVMGFAPTPSIWMDFWRHAYRAVAA